MAAHGLASGGTIVYTGRRIRYGNCSFLFMLIVRRFACRFLLGLCLTGQVLLPASADEKEGMPDLGQQDQTCLPTSTANLIVWFGTHGYPKLIVNGDG